MLDSAHRSLKVGILMVIVAIFLSPVLATYAQDPYTGQLIQLDLSTSSLTPEQIADLMTGFTSTPTGNDPVGVLILTGFATYSLDTQAAFGLSCDQIVVYKVSPTRTQERWDDVTCEGNTLYIHSAGTGHYLLYYLGDVSDPLQAPQLITINVGDL